VTPPDHERDVVRRCRRYDDPIDAIAVESELLRHARRRRHGLRIHERATLERLDPAGVREMHDLDRDDRGRRESQLSASGRVQANESGLTAHERVRSGAARCRVLGERSRRPVHDGLAAPAHARVRSTSGYPSRVIAIGRRAAARRDRDPDELDDPRGHPPDRAEYAAYHVDHEHLDPPRDISTFGRATRLDHLLYDRDRSGSLLELAARPFRRCSPTRATLRGASDLSTV